MNLLDLFAFSSHGGTYYRGGPPPALPVASLKGFVF